VKNLKWFLLLITLALSSGRSEEWRKVAFIGDAEVKTISGVVEIVSGKQERILHEKETARVGQVLRVWRGAEVVLQMKNTKSLVRAKGPVLLRLAPDSETYDRASITGEEDQTGFIVRAVRGGGKYQDGEFWKPLRTGMCLPEGTHVLLRSGKNSVPTGVVIPFGRGRLIMIGTTWDKMEVKLNEAFLQVIYGSKAAKP